MRLGVGAAEVAELALVALRLDGAQRLAGEGQAAGILGGVGRVEEGGEGGAEVEAQPAAVADVELALLFGEQCRLVPELRRVHRQLVHAGRSVLRRARSVLGHATPRQANAPKACLRGVSRFVSASFAGRRLHRVGRLLARDLAQALVEPSGMRLLGAGQRLEPLRQLVEALVARGLGHTGVHLGVLVGLAVHRGLEVLLGAADGVAGGGVADRFEEVEMAEGVARLGLGGVAEEAADVGIAFDVGCRAKYM